MGLGGLTFVQGYDCLSKALIEVVMGKWPELAPGQLEA